MIPGTVASSLGGFTEAPGGGSYPGALAAADFVLGEYWVDEAAMTAADMIDRDDLIDVDGLLLQWDTGGGVVSAIGDFATTLGLMNWTLVMEWNETVAGQMFPLMFESGGFAEQFYIESRSSDLKVGVYDQPEPGANRAAENFSVAARPATRRIAVTRTNAKLVASVNGSSIISDAVSTNTPGHDNFWLGGADSGFAYMKGHIKRVIVYPPRDDADLPALSTP